MRAAFRRITNPCIFSKPEWPITAVLLTPDDRPAAESIPEAIKSPPMNFYPSWIHRIPEMLEALALLANERIDRRRVEELFDLRRSAAHELLRRFGAERCGNSLAISRGKLMARLREAQEHPDWRWERERRQSRRNRIETLRPGQRKSEVPVTRELQKQLDAMASSGLPQPIRFDPGRLTITCRDMEHLVKQLVLVAKALD
jgi:hypothetical protein